jgi:hypothetical protein
MTTPPTPNWSNRIGKVVTESLLFSKLIAWPAFDAALAVAVAEIAKCLAKASDAAEANGRSPDQAWVAEVANSIIASLLKIRLVPKQDADRAIEIVLEELTTTLALGDRPQS